MNLNHVTFHNDTLLSTVYACGLRISEALALQVPDIDSPPVVIHVHRDRGAKDRYVPLPQNTLQLLFRYWVTYRNPLRNPLLIFSALSALLFPASDT